MLDWLRDHFSLSVWHVSFGVPTTFGILSIRYVSWSDSYEVQVEVLGFGGSLSFHPEGKHAEKSVELPADFFDTATVCMSWECYQDMKRDQDELRAIKGRHAD